MCVLFISSITEKTIQLVKMNSTEIWQVNTATFNLASLKQQEMQSIVTTFLPWLEFRKEKEGQKSHLYVMKMIMHCVFLNGWKHEFCLSTLTNLFKPPFLIKSLLPQQEFFERLYVMYTIGYSISFCSLAVAVLIIGYFRWVTANHFLHWRARFRFLSTQDTEVSKFLRRYWKCESSSANNVYPFSVIFHWSFITLIQCYSIMQYNI